MQVIEESGPRHRAKKDTKRWCKGKVGRTHLFGEWIQLYPAYQGRGRYWHERVCQTCGRKEFDMLNIELEVRVSALTTYQHPRL